MPPPAAASAAAAVDTGNRITAAAMAAAEAGNRPMAATAPAPTAEKGFRRNQPHAAGGGGGGNRQQTNRTGTHTIENQMQSKIKCTQLKMKQVLRNTIVIESVNHCFGFHVSSESIGGDSGDSSGCGYR